jgi:D-arabinose 1-dehydrogenase-like Zn-dependent alcohol dehydrogenase
MNSTYTAIELSGPGKFSEVRKPLLDPGPNHVRIRVEAWGVCHLDSGTVEGLFPSHAAMVSHPKEVTDLIISAAESTAKSSVGLPV